MQLYLEGTYKILEILNMEKNIEEILKSKDTINGDKFQYQFIETTDIDNKGKNANKTCR